jgi:hypothetical protein
VEVNKKKFKKFFPYLAKELEEKRMAISIASVRWDKEAAERRATLRGFMPDVIDFLRRCDTEKEGLEIIDYMEKRGEISSKYANRLRRQLKEKGIRSFGPKKEPGYYFRKYYRR